MTTLDELLMKEVKEENNATLNRHKTHAAEDDDNDDEKLKKKVNKGAWGIAKEKVDAQVSVERVQNFEEAFLKIKAATGIADIEELVQTFIKNEDQNFSLFNYVNEQTNEIEKLEEHIQQLKEEEQKYAQESGEDTQQQKHVLKELELKVASTESAVDKYEMRCNSIHMTIEELKKGISSMFTKIECDPGTMLEDAAHATVTEANILQYLGLIEARCNEVLQSYAAYQQKERARQQALDRTEDEDAISGAAAVLNVLGTGPTIPVGHELIHVNPPKLDDASSEEGSDNEDDNELRPLTRDELKAKALSRMNRRRGGAGASKKNRK
jgi:coiled-coil domain-containing protein 63/114